VPWKVDRTCQHVAPLVVLSWFTGLAVGVGAAGYGLLANAIPALTKTSADLRSGDAAILRFLSALEILETDLWQQYNELGGIQDKEVPGGKRESSVHQGAQSAGRGHGPVHPRQHRGRVHALHLHQRLSRFAGRQAGQPGSVPHPAEQQGNRRAADRTAHQPYETDGRYQLVHALPQPHRRAPISVTGPRKRFPG